MVPVVMTGTLCVTSYTRLFPGDWGPVRGTRCHVPVLCHLPLSLLVTLM